EDGIRDDLVTGVQTCALPILACANRCFPASAPQPFRQPTLASWGIGECNTRSDVLVVPIPIGFLSIGLAGKGKTDQWLVYFSLQDRKSTRLNYSHQIISYHVF